MNTTPIKSSQELLDTVWAMFLSFAVVIALTMIPMDVLAGAGGGAGAADDNPIARMLCRIVQFFTGSTGKALATIAIIIVGIGALMGKISWGLAFIVAMGVALVFGATQIVRALGATAQGGCTGGETLGIAN